MVCGSFGRGAEGRLLACSQCGQCYHPFCVNVKVRMNGCPFGSICDLITGETFSTTRTSAVALVAATSC